MGTSFEYRVSRASLFQLLYTAARENNGRFLPVLCRTYSITHKNVAAQCQTHRDMCCRMKKYAHVFIHANKGHSLLQARHTVKHCGVTNVKKADHESAHSGRANGIGHDTHTLTRCELLQIGTCPVLSAMCSRNCFSAARMRKLWWYSPKRTT